MKPRQILVPTLSGLARLLLASSMAAPAAAQESPAPASDRPFAEQIAVSVVNVEVYVTDREGKPVTSLTRDDFEVTEDGRPVELVNFYRVAGGRPEAEPPPSAEPEAAAPPPAEPVAFAPADLSAPESQRLHLIVYVDNFNIHPLNRNRVFSRLRLFLHDTLRPGDQVMVASYDRSLHIRHPFTSDPASVNRALLELEEFSGMALERESERADAIKKIYETDSVHEALFEAKSFAENQEHELHLALDALAEMIESLAGLPGRKMLLHLSDGIALVPGQDLYQAVQQRFADISALGQAQERDASRRYISLIAQANSNRVTFYTIDASGLETRAVGAETAAISSPIVVGSAVSSVRARNLQDSLLLMADRTGGQAILNTNDVSAGLERIGRDFDNYYSLGYRAPATDRGIYHRIEVRLKEKRPGWDVRHREGYRDKTIENRVNDGVQAFLFHGYQQNPLGVSIDLGPQTPDDDDFTSVAIQVRVPIEKLVLLPQGDVYVGRLRFYFGAVDEKGRDAELQELPFELRIPRESIEVAKRDEVSQVINATMRRGRQKLVVAVRDEISDERSVVGRFVDVGSG